MTDLDIINQIEKIIKILLMKVYDINNYSIGYTINQNAQVTGLGLYGCKIGKIERFISALQELKSLTTLVLSYNQISDISALHELKNLTTLYLFQNQISDISNLQELKSLTTLVLSYNQISDISALHKLVDLKTLSLVNNQISDISPLNELMHLTTLDLSGNKISDISPLLKLNCLTTLDLSGNKISDISALQELKSLTSLSLLRNQISDISALRELKSLTILSLFNNQISDISALQELKRLIKLVLSNNKISDISALQELFNKDNIEIDVRYNPLITPPVGIVKQGKEAIRSYFEQLKKQGKDKIHEAKLMIVGEPGAGKTTLLNKLFNKDFDVPNPEQKSTLGVEVRKNWEFHGNSHFDTSINSVHRRLNDPKDINYKAHIWDFGGQQIQYMLHQFFLTSDCVYVLMAEKRRELANFDYWLNIINILGRKSEVIVLFNEINIDSATSFIYNEKKYKDLFPGIHLHRLDVNFANMKDGRFDTLVNKIKEKLAGLEHIGKEVPARWVDIRMELEERNDEKHLAISEYFNICHKYGIDEEEDRMFILKYFNILGIVLHFPDDLNLRDTLFLDPNWTVDAVYSVLTDPEIENNHGLFNTKKIDKIWNSKGYNREERTQLMQLMLKDNFELCYKLPKNNDEYLVPLLLCKIKPTYEWNENGNLQFRFQYPFMPKGIVSRLIVRLNEFLEQDKLWNEGAVFSKNGARAQVIEKETTREGLKIIEIRLTGTPDKRKELLTLIREEIRKIQDSSFPSLPYFEMIPCNCKECKGMAENEFYSNYDLENLLVKNINKIQCRKSGEMININELVDSVYDMNQLREMFNPKKGYNTIHSDGNNNIILQDIQYSDIRITGKKADLSGQNALEKSKSFSQKEYEGYHEQLDLLIEKSIAFEKAKILAYDTGKKFSDEQELKEIYKQIKKLKEKLS